jgi:hypothetical protein
MCLRKNESCAELHKYRCRSAQFRIAQASRRSGRYPRTIMKKAMHLAGNRPLQGVFSLFVENDSDAREMITLIWRSRSNSERPEFFPVRLACRIFVNSGDRQKLKCPDDICRVN